MNKLILLVLFTTLIPLVSANPTPYGYEIENDTVHAWNPKLDYYWNKTSGLQFSNHYNEYWTKNIFCLGYKASSWVYKCNDGVLKDFTWNLKTDNLTYFEAVGHKDVTIQGYDVRVALRYVLNESFYDLVVQPYIENRDANDIPVDIGFAWHTRDINVGLNNLSNEINIGWVERYNLSDNLALAYTNLEFSEYQVSNGIGEWFGVKWDGDLNYLLEIVSNPSQYNAPITLGINAGTLTSGQNKTTVFLWKDAVCRGSWGNTTSINATSGTYFNSTPTYFPAGYDFNSGGAGKDFMRFSGEHGGIIERLTCYVEDYGVCALPPNAPSVCNEAGNGYIQCHIQERLSGALPMEEGKQTTLPYNNGVQNNSIARSPSADNCDLDDGTDSGVRAVYNNRQLKHNNFTDFKCITQIWSHDGFFCGAAWKGNIKMDNFWFNNHTPSAENVTVQHNTNNRTCLYDFLDLDGDPENTSQPYPIISWWRDGKLENQTNTSYINSTRDYVCCVTVKDYVFWTGREQGVCSGDLNFEFLGALALGTFGAGFFLFFIVFKINDEHKYIKWLWRVSGLLLIWASVFIFANFMAIDAVIGLNASILSAFIFLLIVLVYWIFYRLAHKGR